jgi:hypothetical protein
MEMQGASSKVAGLALRTDFGVISAVYATEKNGSSGRTRIPTQTYIQQHVEQQTAVLAILVHARQCKWQVNGR